MRLLLKVTPIDFTPTATNLEARFLSIIEDGGFPTPLKQVDSGNRDAWIGRVDFETPTSRSSLRSTATRFTRRPSMSRMTRGVRRPDPRRLSRRALHRA